MSEQLREALSAIVDGEASNFELRRVLDEISKDESLQTTWQNYHLMRSAMQGENTQNVATMSDRIWAELDFEGGTGESDAPELELEPAIAEQPRRRWGLGLGGGAIAAAIATVMLVGGDLPSTGNGDAASQVAQEQIETPTTNTLLADNPSVDSATGVLDGIQSADYTAPVGEEPQAQSVAFTQGDAEVDYGPGFISLSSMTPEQRAHTEGRFMRHVQQRAMNNSNLMNFTKMITYEK